MFLLVDGTLARERPPEWWRAAEAAGLGGPSSIEVWEDYLDRIEEAAGLGLRARGCRATIRPDGTVVVKGWCLRPEGTMEEWERTHPSVEEWVRSSGLDP